MDAMEYLGWEMPGLVVVVVMLMGSFLEQQRKSKMQTTLRARLHASLRSCRLFRQRESVDGSWNVFWAIFGTLFDAFGMDAMEYLGWEMPGLVVVVVMLMGSFLEQQRKSKMQTTLRARLHASLRSCRLFRQRESVDGSSHDLLHAC
ncbi:hypothetical protein HRR83_004798 [Exophiala dermatitidis]|uniref:Copper transporter n=1 Tax=Exophiala dermatitidis TaxID=5970 RepID=A0AAN6J170_EXODE|nr:hypothetical protein HRR76_002425 [Exophiala dermatitidis]KAJ4597367.1 hypothetical protein HRR83_004798 [Exophiala dermatitidis]KAJ4650996.1 hypothetical protein HRR91_005605 [Exophiala dermatitidis]KAJ8994261.1 hypothetical protein HRR80_002756 [Exophiala dermatitidis]